MKTFDIYQQWLNSRLKMKEELLAISNQPQEIEDRFYKPSNSVLEELEEF